MSMLRSAVHGTIAVATSITLAGAGVFGAGFAPALLPAVSAQETAANPHVIPATGNLAIHKSVGMPTGLPNNGTEQNPQLPPAAGIKFNVYQVNDTDLTKEEGWTTASKTKLADLFNGRPAVETLKADKVGKPVVVTTGADGSATASKLPAGQYLVVEESNPVTSGGTAVAPSVPFLVTVPATNPDGNGWLDTVHVYPKNQSAAIKPEKQVTDPVPTGDTNLTGAATGERLGFAIASGIPSLAEGNSLSG